ncbi:TetR/AcrR family transcriptional regulator [Streptomyces sp. SBT349]|uniref:TetR/AcrR family transcriptional regulator n=1 Tax=Streptomyces sp. SBT349 TaxID=1580539 RepID=UPI00066E490F|nr:TetR/AcrR family transcriptional regulator [Streptomyces sp. SBT349]
MSALTARGAATRRRIVEGAAVLVRERGVANVSLDDVRAATSTSKSQLFHYFPDGKSDLLLAVAEYEADQVLEDQQPMLGELTTWGAWEAWRERVIEKYDAQRETCPLSALTAQLGRADPSTRRVISDLYERWHGHLAAGVRALRERGEIPREADPDQAATAVLTALAGGVAILQATGRLSYLEVALSEALAALRRAGAHAVA